MKKDSRDSQESIEMGAIGKLLAYFSTNMKNVETTKRLLNHCLYFFVSWICFYSVFELTIDFVKVPHTASLLLYQVNMTFLDRT